MSTKIDLKKFAQLAKAKGDPKKKDMPLIGEKGIHIGKKSLEKSQVDTSNISPLKKKPLPSVEVKKKGPLLKLDDKKNPPPPLRKV